MRLETCATETDNVGSFLALYAKEVCSEAKEKFKWLMEEKRPVWNKDFNEKEQHTKYTVRIAQWNQMLLVIAE